MKSAEERFLQYITFDTQSDESGETCPSTAKQLKLAEVLAKEMQEMGLLNVKVDENGYVYGFIPATQEGLPALGLIAHMDTAPDCSGANIKAQKLLYTGEDLLLNAAKQIYLKKEDFPYLENYVGQYLICTDGTTLLGADDKAGVSEILAAAEQIAAMDRKGEGFAHGKICIGFTPDEEIGRGADHFDLNFFGADYAYTVDGGALGELEYENFNAASMMVQVEGVNIHPGSAKNKMKNALEIAMEFAALLPADQKPRYTEKYEGFFHLNEMQGDVEHATMAYILRDHDLKKLQVKKALAESAAAYINQKWGEGTVKLVLKDNYYNMKEKIEPCFFLVENAVAAMKEAGFEALIQPIRGGTDGARLSFEGLPCPNLCTGGENFHGRFEFISCESMEKITEMLIALVRITGEQAK